MKKRGTRVTSKSKTTRVKHHFKLAGLFASKLIMSFVAFIIGLYLGSLIADTFTALFIGVVIAALIYLLFVLHIIDWFNI